MTHQPSSRRFTRLAMMVSSAAAVSCAVALSACGSAAVSNRTGTGPANRTSLPFTQCMRAHGVPNFPDPLPSGGFARDVLDRQSPAFQTASAECIHLIKAGASPPGPTADQRAAALTYARCMRAHGVPDFPDPATSSSSHDTNAMVQGGLIFPLGSAIDPNSPAFQHADTECGRGGASGRPKGG